METIRKCIRLTMEKMDSKLNYTQANYQSTLKYFLSKFGSCQKEQTITYQFKDGREPITFGIGRIDLFWRPHTSPKAWLIELKISPKPYKIEAFFPQIRRYCHHWKEQFSKCEGVVICFSPWKTSSVHIVNSLT